MKNLMAYIEWDPETKLYVGIIPGIPGVHAQGATWNELQKKLKRGARALLRRKPGFEGEFATFCGLTGD